LPENADHLEEKGLEEDHDAQGDTEIVDPALESLEQALERLDVELVPLNEEASQPETGTAPAEAALASDDAASPHADASSSTPPSLYADPTSEDDDEGEWITPENVSLHKARAMGLAPSRNGSVRAKGKEIIPVGCMTADFAMQNVLLQMDLSLVGIEGKKIQKVKTWVLRCHACFKCVRHLPGVFVTHFYLESVRTRRRNFALRVATLHYFAHLSPYHPPPPLRTPQLCKCI
jgi:RNA-binding protein NOB1